MQPKLKSKRYKKLLIGSVIVFVLGLLFVFIGLSNLYGAVNKCGFGAGTCTYSSAHGILTKLGSIVAGIGFYASLLFLILFLVARYKEKKVYK
jgi:hypothetical protein